MEAHEIWIAVLTIGAGLNLLLQSIMLKLFLITRSDCRAIRECLDTRVRETDCRERHRMMETAIRELNESFEKHGHEGLRGGSRVTL